MELQFVSYKEAVEIVHERKPLGKFYTKEGNFWMGIDNVNGNAWTEKFYTEELCKKWVVNEQLAAA